MAALCTPIANVQAVCAEEVFSTSVLNSSSEISEKALNSTLAYDLVESLTTKVGARLAGSPAEARAREWAADNMRSLGFSNVRIETFRMTGWERGEAAAEVTSPFPQKLMITALSNSAATPEAGIEAEVVRFENYQALLKADHNTLADKIAFIDGIMVATQDFGGIREAGPRRRTGAIEAAKRGAVGIVIRSIGTSEHRFAHTGPGFTEDGVPMIPSAALANADADQLARIFRFSEGPVTMRLVLTPRPVENVLSGNVIGEIPGTAHPDEIVLLGSHIDSWDMGTGALDAGAGVATVMAAAKLIKESRKRPKRTIRVVLFGAEEFNLEGARNYTERYKAEVPNHVIAVESDLGAAPVLSFATNVPEDMFEKIDAVAKVLAPLGIIRGDNAANGGEDLTFLRRQGTPIAALTQDARQYFDYHHTEDDTLDKINRAALQQNVAVYAQFAYLASHW